MAKFIDFLILILIEFHIDINYCCIHLKTASMYKSFIFAIHKWHYKTATLRKKLNETCSSENFNFKTIFCGVSIYGEIINGS